MAVSRESQTSEFQTANDDVSGQQGEASSGVAVSRKSQTSEVQTANHNDLRKTLHGGQRMVKAGQTDT